MPDDPPILVDLEDEVRGAVDDRAQFLALSLERLPKPRSGERDRQLVASELGDAQAVGVEVAARRDAAARRPAAGGSSPSTITCRSGRLVASPRPASTPSSASGRSGGEIAAGGDARQAVVARPRPARSRLPTTPDSRVSSMSDGPGELGRRTARRDQLAELVLGEERIGLALGLVEGAPVVGLERRQPVLEAFRSSEFARPSAAGQRNEEDLARHSAGVEMARRPRPEAQREPSPSDEWARRAHAAATGLDGGLGGSRTPRRRAATAAAYASAAGPSVSRIVLSPIAHRPRRASPAAATAEHVGDQRRRQDLRVAGSEAGLDQRRAVERARTRRRPSPRGGVRRPEGCLPGGVSAGSSSSSSSTDRNPVARLSP